MIQQNKHVKICIMCKKNRQPRNPKPYRKVGKKRWAAHELLLPSPKTIIVSACCSIKGLFISKQPPVGPVKQEYHRMM